MVSWAISRQRSPRRAAPRWAPVPIPEIRAPCRPVLHQAQPLAGGGDRVPIATQEQLGASEHQQASGNMPIRPRASRAERYQRVHDGVITDGAPRGGEQVAWPKARSSAQVLSRFAPIRAARSRFVAQQQAMPRIREEDGRSRSRLVGQGVQSSDDLVGQLAVAGHQHHAHGGAQPSHGCSRIARAELGSGIDEQAGAAPGVPYSNSPLQRPVPERLASPGPGWRRKAAAAARPRAAGGRRQRPPPRPSRRTRSPGAKRCGRSYALAAVACPPAPRRAQPSLELSRDVVVRFDDRCRPVPGMPISLLGDSQVAASAACAASRRLNGGHGQAALGRG